MSKWDNDTTIKFIQYYKSHPCLYDFSSKDYKNKQKREDAISSIAEEMNIPGFGTTETKNKIKNLRSTYSQEIKKIQDSKKSGVGVPNVYISNIKWLNEMEEVFAKDLKKPVFENINEPINQATESQERGFAIPSSSSIPVTVSSQATPTREETNTPTTATTSIGYTPRTKKRTRDIIKAVSDLKKISDDANSEVESVWDAFGKSVAMQLKNMSIENALLAQCRVQSILTEFGLKDHREKTLSRSAMSNYSSRTSSSDVTDMGYVHSPSNYLEESVTSPPRILPASASGQQTTYTTQLPNIYLDQSVASPPQTSLASTSGQQVIFTTQSPNIYLDQSVASPPQISLASASRQQVILTTQSPNIYLDQSVASPPQTSSASASGQKATTQPEPVQGQSSSDNDIISAAMNAARVFKSTHSQYYE